MSERIKLILKEHGGIILITALAAAFRLAFFDNTVYWPPDYSQVTYQALQILEEHRLPTTSIDTLFGLANPPLMAYLQVLPLLIARSPLAVQIFITSLNLLAVPLTYFLGLRLLDKKTALAAALLYAISPWAVYFSRGSWVQGLLPLFTSLICYFLFPALLERKAPELRLITALAILTFMTQTYVLAYFAILQVALLLFAFRRRVGWRPLVTGIIFFLIISLPYTYAILSGSEVALATGKTLVGVPWVADLEALKHAFRLVTGAGYNDYVYTQYINTPPKDTSQMYSTLASLADIASLGLALLLSIGVGNGIWRLIHKEPTEIHTLLLAWFFVPVAIMTPHPVKVEPQYLVQVEPWYLLLTYPAGFLLAGAGARLLFFHMPKVATSLALVLAVLFGSVITISYQTVSQHYKVLAIEFLPLRYAMRLGQEVRNAVEEVYVHAPRHWISAISGTLIKPYAKFEEENFVVLRANRPALYILLNPHVLSPAFSFSQELIDKRIDLPNNDSVRFFHFDPRSKEELAIFPFHPLNLQLDIGWLLLGYDLPSSASPGEAVEFTTYWLVENFLRERGALFFSPFAHLLNSKGEVLAITGGHGQAGYLWRRGDFYIDTLNIPIPLDLAPGEYWLYTGLWDPNSSTRALFPNGQDHMLIGPLHIE